MRAALFTAMFLLFLSCSPGAVDPEKIIGYTTDATPYNKHKHGGIPGRTVDGNGNRVYLTGVRYGNRVLVFERTAERIITGYYFSDFVNHDRLVKRLKIDMDYDEAMRIAGRPFMEYCLSYLFPGRYAKGSENDRIFRVYPQKPDKEERHDRLEISNWGVGLIFDSDKKLVEIRKLRYSL